MPEGSPATSEALMGIGAFSKASRLSLKALRLYDALGLLSPAKVDEESGYPTTGRPSWRLRGSS
jgi:hypothetical protein